MKSVFAGLLIVIAGILSYFAVTPPPVVPVSAPLNAFSAARAAVDLAWIASAPRPTGSPQNAEIQTRLIARMEELGMKVERQTGVGVSDVSRRAKDVQGSVGVAVVSNLIAVLPGSDPKLPAVAIMAHYDSVEGANGAGDDGAAVASALEMARALGQEKHRVRDVMLIITDAEEAGLLGAHAFFAVPANVARVGAILNMDSRGSRGQVTLFETGPNSGGLVALYRKVATHRFAQSPATFLYKQLPNNTDLTVSNAQGIAALNFAFVDGEYDYHTAGDTVANLDPRVMQSFGDQVLPVARALATSAVLPERRADAAFGDMPYGMKISYPLWMGWILLGVAALTSLLALRGQSALGIAKGAASGLWFATTILALFRLARRLTGVGSDWPDAHRLMAEIGRYELSFVLLLAAMILLFGFALARGAMRTPMALLGLAAGLACSGFGGFDTIGLAAGVVAASAAYMAFAQPVTNAAAWGGLRLIGLALAVVMQALAPAVAPMLLWPLLATSLAAAITVRDFGKPQVKNWAILALISLYPLAYTMAFGHSILISLGGPTPEALALSAFIVAMMLVPFVHGRSPLTAIIAALAIIGALALAVMFHGDHGNPRHPLLTRVHMLLDADSGKAQRISIIPQMEAWTDQVMRADGGAPVLTTNALLSPEPIWVADAKAFAMMAPAFSAGKTADGRTIITLTPAPGMREMRMLLTTDAAASDVELNGVKVAKWLDEAGKWRLRFVTSAAPLTLVFRPAKPGMMAVEAFGLQPEWPASATPLPIKPATIAPWYGSEQSLVTISRKVVL